MLVVRWQTHVGNKEKDYKSTCRSILQMLDQSHFKPDVWRRHAKQNRTKLAVHLSLPESFQQRQNLEDRAVATFSIICSSQISASTARSALEFNLESRSQHQDHFLCQSVKMCM